MIMFSLLSPQQMEFFDDVLNTYEDCCVKNDFTNLPYGPKINSLILEIKNMSTEEWSKQLIELIIDGER